MRYALEGSLQVEPERVRITAQLIETSTGAHLWSERYDRPANDLFAVRDEVLTRLVGTLTGYDGPIWAEWREAARRKPPQSLGAWDYLLLANKPYRRHDKEGNAEARRLLEKAIELDPGLARAWEFLANTHMQDWINGWTGDRARSLALMRETALLRLRHLRQPRPDGRAGGRDGAARRRGGAALRADAAGGAGLALELRQRRGRPRGG